MSQEKLQTMVVQKSWGVIEVYYGIVQVVNPCLAHDVVNSVSCGRARLLPLLTSQETRSRFYLKYDDDDDDNSSEIQNS